VYDYKGEIYCICPATGEMRSMAYWGYEKDRHCIKYRCPPPPAGLTDLPVMGADTARAVTANTAA